MLAIALNIASTQPERPATSPPRSGSNPPHQGGGRWHHDLHGFAATAMSEPATSPVPQRHPRDGGSEHLEGTRFLPSPGPGRPRTSLTKCRFAAA